MTIFTYPAIKNMWLASPVKILLLAVLLVPISALASSLIITVIESIGKHDALPLNFTAKIMQSDSKTYISIVFGALLIAPIVENFCCYIWFRFMSSWNIKTWWIKPFIIAWIAVFFHMVSYLDFREIVVFPMFFVIASFITQVENKVLGFWASVLHHFTYNGVSLILALL
jgi:hypothetical protein